jgi:hypothetical protein
VCGVNKEAPGIRTSSARSRTRRKREKQRKFPAACNRPQIHGTPAANLVSEFQIKNQT